MPDNNEFESRQQCCGKDRQTVMQKRGQTIRFDKRGLRAVCVRYA